MKSCLKNIIVVILLSGSIISLPAQGGAASSWLPSFIASRLYPQSDKVRYFNPRVAVLHIDAASNLKERARDLFLIGKDENIHGLLLVVNHSGGSIGQFSVLHDMIIRIKKVKPVVVLITGGARSGGYMVSCAADYVIAHGLSEIGCIGVVQELERWTEVNASRNDYNALAKMYVFKAGKYKGLYHSANVDFTDEEKEYIQQDLEKAYQEFLALVARDRNLDIAQSSEWADGKELLAPEALRVRLIDEIGTMFEAESKLLELMGKKRYEGWQMSNSIAYVEMS